MVLPTSYPVSTHKRGIFHQSVYFLGRAREEVSSLSSSLLLSLFRVSLRRFCWSNYPPWPPKQIPLPSWHSAHLLQGVWDACTSLVPAAHRGKFHSLFEKFPLLLLQNQIRWALDREFCLFTWGRGAWEVLSPHIPSFLTSCLGLPFPFEMWPIPQLFLPGRKDQRRISILHFQFCLILKINLDDF